MTASTIVVTGCDADYFRTVSGTVPSLLDKPQVAGVTVGFLDVGLDAEQRADLQRRGVAVADAGWDYDFPTRASCPPHRRGQFCRPHLRRYFPGFEVYLWLDADTWVQDWRAVELLRLGAWRRRGMAVVPEIDRGNARMYGGQAHYWGYVKHHYALNFGDAVADQLCHYPLLNSGVFALHRDAPHWEAWDRRLAEALLKSDNFLCEQTACNLAVYGDGLSGRTEMLPAWCNWPCHSGLPAWDPAAGQLVEPYLPHTPIGILHQTGQEKPERAVVPWTTGGQREVSLRYSPR